MGVIDGSYNVWLVVLSVAVSMLGSFASLKVARQITSDRGRGFWIGLAAFALGGGAIWSMHFIGMLAFDLGLPVRYDWLLTALSLGLAVGVTALGYWFVSFDTGRLSRCCLAGLVTGLGVAGMHYTGMAAMRMAATMTWHPGLIVLSVVIAILAASAAMWLAFNRRRWQTAIAAVVMGLAISGMHYTGMAAATFHYATASDLATYAVAPELLAYTVFLIAVFTIAVAITVADTPAKRLLRRLKARDWRGSGGVALLAGVAAIPILAGWWGHTALDRALKQRLAEELQTVLQADVAALEIWFERQRHTVEVAAADPDVVRLVERLEAATGAGARGALETQLAARLRPVADAYGYADARLFDLHGRAGGDADIPGRGPANDRWASFVAAVAVDGPAVSLPMRLGADAAPATVAMYAAAPIRAADGRALGVLAFTIDPAREFFRILTIARSGDSGETYAFDRDGVLISPSRFAAQLASLGVIDSAATNGVLEVSLRDPGGNLLTGYQPDPAAGDRPLTRMARAAVTGETGLDVEGYRDYRGVPVVGAWTWLESAGIGVTTEVDVAEALGRVAEIRRGLWALLGLLATGAVGLLVGHGAIRRLRHRVERAQRLGQYTLEKRVGAGGMGVVYKARHAMLRRPTAVKLLQSDQASAHRVARFEREVQLTARLTHPNTIAIYDYGRTPEGAFYYAMEYLSGHALDDLVGREGAQPEARVIHILRQACGSLTEAHGIGLIHRDVKPSNLMLCDRGGQVDVVKVLDFGLVKEVGPESDTGLTQDGMFTGTPNYTAPESVTSADGADARGDLYCLGAVGYFLLTGQHVFDSASAMEAIAHHLNTEPVPPSTRVGQPISEALDAVILQCLRKDPDARPQSAEALRDLLDGCPVPAWTQAEARRWRDAHPGEAPPQPGEEPTVSSDVDYALTVDVQERIGSTERTG